MPQKLVKRQQGGATSGAQKAEQKRAEAKAPYDARKKAAQEKTAAKKRISVSFTPDPASVSTPTPPTKTQTKIGTSWTEPEKRTVVSDKSRKRITGTQVRKTTTEVTPQRTYSKGNSMGENSITSVGGKPYVEKSKDKYNPRKNQATITTYTKGNRKKTMEKSTIDYKKSGGSTKKK